MSASMLEAVLESGGNVPVKRTVVPWTTAGEWVSPWGRLKRNMIQGPGLYPAGAATGAVLAGCRAEARMLINHVYPQGDQEVS